jgi:hypothetical protein
MGDHPGSSRSITTKDAKKKKKEPFVGVVNGPFAAILEERMECVILAQKAGKNFFLARFGTIQHDLARFASCVVLAHKSGIKHFFGTIRNDPARSSTICLLCPFCT